MKFLKNNLKLIIGFIIGGILAGGIVYAATTSAGEVSYTTDKNAEVSSVEDALNDLYKKQVDSQSERITSMTQEQWNNLSLDQKIAQGLTLIDYPRSTGKFYNYTHLDNTVLSLGGAFTGSSGTRTVSFNTLENRRSTLFISSAMDNSDNSNISINGRSLSRIGSSSNIGGDYMYSHACIIPGFTNNSVSASYNQGDGGTHWSGCYAFDVGNATEIVASKAVFTTSNTITMSIEKCNNMILLINCGFGSGLSNRNYTINGNTYTLDSHGTHFGCSTYAGAVIYSKSEQADSYTVTLPANPGYGFSVTAVGIN